MKIDFITETIDKYIIDKAINTKIKKKIILKRNIYFLLGWITACLLWLIFHYYGVI